jgi:hypothetical protein
VTEAQPLWESNHPYYCTEGSYHETYDSWADFLFEWWDSDPDMNLAFRWDWRKPDPEDYEAGEEVPFGVLEVFFLLQRRGILTSTECKIKREDESAVRAWLQDRVRTLAAIWSPIEVKA